MVSARTLRNLGQSLRRNTSVQVATAIGVGAILCGIGRYWMTRPIASIEEPRYLTYRRHLDAGHPLQFADLKMLPARALAVPPRGAVTDQDLVSLRGATTSSAVEEGSVVTFDSLQLRGDGVRLGKKIPVGMRAFPIPVDASLHLQASDCVDILAAGSADAPSSVALVEGAMVLQVQSGENGPEVLVALSPDEVALVEKARQTGKLKLSLRNPDETPSRRGARREKHRRGARRVQIWSEENG